MQHVCGVVRNYAWGDRHFLPHLLGQEPDGEPWAELWLGTHPSGPATTADGTPLADLTGALPYLLKVLAAEAPLSLQTHPDRARAEQGFAAGIYPDPNPKPELLCALAPTEAFCGVRPVAATLALLDDIGASELARQLSEHGPAATVAALVRGTLNAHPAIEACRGSSRPEATWVERLAERYPDDPSVAVTLLLNLVELAPGEAIHLGAGVLHAYLRGAGVELMGASDNVVRAGLTSKLVDLDELLAVFDATPLDDPVLPATGRYPLPEVGVTLVRLDPGDHHHAVGHELAVDLAGGTWYLAPGTEATVTAPTYVVTT